MDVKKKAFNRNRRLWIQESGIYQQYAKALEFLSDYLERYHGEKAVILIDEYDVPLENAWFEGFYDKMIKFCQIVKQGKEEVTLL